MAYADPISVTIGAPIPLPRTGAGLNAGVFTSADGQTRVRIDHSYGRRTRRVFRLEHSKIAPDPLISAQNVRHSMSTYLVADVPVTGFTNAEAKEVIEGLLTYLTASTGAALTQLLGGES